MNPIDPETNHPTFHPMANAYDEEEVDRELVINGVNVAEDERREAVADAYDSGRREDSDNLDEIDISDFGSDDPSPSALEILSPFEMIMPDLDTKEKQ